VSGPSRAVLAFCIFATALPAAAQLDDRNHVILGLVRDDATHEPVSGASVRLFVGGDKLAATPTLTGADGQFRLDCRKGDFFVQAEKSGYLPAKVKVSIGPGQETDVSLDLHRQSAEDSASTAGPAEAVSAHQLSVPAGARAAFDKGMSLVNSRKDYSAAVAQFEAAIRDAPAYYEAYAELGVADYYLGDARAAEDAFRKSLDLSSGKYSYAVINLAELLNNTARFADAEPLARQASTVADTSWRGFYELARAEFGLKRPVDAEAAASRARELKPDYPLVHLTLLNIHLALHDYHAVLADADAYLNLVPSGASSDQVRKTRAQVQRSLDRPHSP
jgi:Tfp pilus assembly protein PilF